MATLEVFFYTLNEEIGFGVFEAVDMGGSIFVHTFGAFFGLAVSKMCTPKRIEDAKNAEASYTSNMFGVIGCIFLWMYWPSFNGALAVGSA